MSTRLIRLPIRPFARRALRHSILRCVVVAASLQPALASAAQGPARAPASVLAECSWDRPGYNRYRGDVVDAVDRYTDIAPAVRSRLKQRMAQRDYDDMVSIRRDRIAGKRDYDSEIRDMHFGAASICRTVTRAGWNAQMHERGMVYCESGQCILVPTVCRNVSRIVRRDQPAPAASTTQGGGGGAGELAFDPPGAGLSALPFGTVGSAGGTGGDTGSFASRSGDPMPTPLFAGSMPASLGGYGGRSGPALEYSAAEPGRGPAPEPHGPGSALPETGPLPVPFMPELTPARFVPSAPTAAVPEPQSWLLLGGGLALLGAVKRRSLRAARWPTVR